MAHGQLDYDSELMTTLRLPVLGNLLIQVNVELKLSRAIKSSSLHLETSAQVLLAMVKKTAQRPIGHAKGTLQRITRASRSAPQALNSDVECSGIEIPYLNVRGIKIPVPRSNGSGKLAFRLESTLALSSIGTRNSQWERFTGWLALQQQEDILDATSTPKRLHPHALLDFVYEELLDDARAMDVVSTCKSRIEDLGLIPDTSLAVRNLLRVQQRAGFALRGLGDRKQAIPLHSLNSIPPHVGSIKNSPSAQNLGNLWWPCVRT